MRIVGVGKMGEGGQKVQAFSYKIRIKEKEKIQGHYLFCFSILCD